jgi:predicted transcriptional regulator
MVTKAELHRIVDELDDVELVAAARLLARLREDPFMAALEAAPDDDEPLTDEDREAIARGLEEHRTGKTVPWEEVRRELLGD